MCGMPRSRPGPRGQLDGNRGLDHDRACVQRRARVWCEFYCNLYLDCSFGSVGSSLSLHIGSGLSLGRFLLAGCVSARAHFRGLPPAGLGFIYRA